MSAAELAKRNLKEVWRDPLSLAIALVLPLVLLLVLQSIGSEDAPMLLPTMLTPGVTLVGFALGMILGAVFTVTQVSGGYAVVLLLTIFGGAWFDLADIGGVFQTVGNVLPFKHALDATRAVMADRAGFGDITTDLAWVGGYAVVTVLAAVFLFRRRMTE